VPEAISSSGHEDMVHGIDTIVSQFHYSDVGDVTITGGWYHLGEYPISMEITVVGDNGVVEYSSAGRPITVYWSDGRKEPLAPEEKDGYQAELEYFLDCCTKGCQPQECMPGDSSLAVKLTKLMVEARDRKGEKVTCRF
jgi:predicted dehydrogenase